MGGNRGLLLVYFFERLAQTMRYPSRPCGRAKWRLYIKQSRVQSPL